MSEDITYCTAYCKNSGKCERNPKRIKMYWLPHSYADLSNICDRYMKGERNGRFNQQTVCN